MTWHLDNRLESLVQWNFGASTLNKRETLIIPFSEHQLQRSKIARDKHRNEHLVSCRLVTVTVFDRAY